jgi:hypothetical protein
MLGEILDYPHQMVLGNSKGVANLARIDAAIREVGKVEQDPEGVVSMKREMHPTNRLAGWRG